MNAIKRWMMVSGFGLAALTASAGNLILVGDSTLAPRKPELRIGSWGDSMGGQLAEGWKIVKNGKDIFDTCHPSKAGAKRYGEAFIADAKARKLSVAAIFK